MNNIKENFINALLENPELLEIKWAVLEKKFKIPPTSRPGDRARRWYQGAIKDETKITTKAVLPKGKIKPKRLIFDIETSPNIGLFWNAGWKQTIPYDNIIKERAIICICYKWEGEKKVHSLTWDKKQDDKEMLKAFIEVANEADEMVGHNGDKFDLTWIRTRCLYHRLSMFPKYMSLDTLKVSRSKFRFNSNRLDYIAKFLGIGTKIKTEYSLWKEVLLDNNEDSLNMMVKYCKWDVELLEKVYTELKNHIEPKQHYGKLYADDKTGCPECGSGNLKYIRTRATALGSLRAQYICNDCGKYHTKAAK